MSGAIIYVCNTISFELKIRYPIVDCQKIYEEYDSDLDNHSWKNSAAKEYRDNKWRSDRKKSTEYFGDMQCLCEETSERFNKTVAQSLSL